MRPQLFFDDATPGREELVQFSGKAAAIVEVQRPEDVGAALDEIDRLRRNGMYVAGYLSYELGYALECRLAPLTWPGQRIPLLWFAAFERATASSGSSVASYLLGLRYGRAYAGPLKHGWDARDYRRRFGDVRALIEAGDIYQANLTFRSSFSFSGDPLAFYCRLRERSNAAYGAYVDDGARTILSLSPELFFQISPAGRIVARPMKGTQARHADAAYDEQLRGHLANSAKDRAENLMIVDLLRNDLGRIAAPGSVDVRNLFAIETYPTVHQMVSTVTAQLPPDAGTAAVISALFPCGSITGAPKIRAMEIIRSLEDTPRGVYCGAVGYFSPDGSARFSVAIRTLTIEQGRGELGIGGGVVYDSESESEYAECLLKARFFEEARKPIGLIETMRFTPEAGLVRRDNHIARIENSAGILGIAFDRPKTQSALDQVLVDFDGVKRVRLELQESGSLHCSAEPFDDSGGQSWTFVLSPQRVRSTDRLAAHKTSWRRIYDMEQARVSHETGCDEVVFLNERGELVEGSRTNIFVELEGRLWTPPLDSGCLDGCLRRELLDSGTAGERTLVPDDLERAVAIYLGNSLRGLIPAKPADGSRTALRPGPPARKAAQGTPE
jgi:para-aminobenzoate synthetase/4-amino-4-deoxychorismate lyase